MVQMVMMAGDINSAPLATRSRERKSYNTFRDRIRERQTERQAKRQTERQTDREIDINTETNRVTLIQLNQNIDTNRKK